MLNVIPTAAVSRIILNSTHLSGLDAVQQRPNLKVGGLVQILSGTPVKLILKVGVSGSHGWA